MSDQTIPSQTARIEIDRRRCAMHVLVLVLLGVLIFTPGLDRHGVTNWQEAKRLVVAREMQDRHRVTGDWRELIAPRANGQAYLAKPPMIYWAQIAIADMLGERVSLWHLRLTVALAGVAGVLATYFAAILILSPDRDDRRLLGAGARDPRETAHTRAFWAAAMLGTGFLFVRSGRIGELDILLAPACTIAIAAIAWAWRVHRIERRTSFPGVLIAAGAAAIATLIKDPGVMIVALAGYGGMAMYYALAPVGSRIDAALLLARRRAPLALIPQPTGRQVVVRRILTLVVASAAGVLAARNAAEPRDLAGVGVLMALGGLIGSVLGRLLEPVRLLGLLTAWSRTHPVAVLGAALAARLGWARLVEEIVGAEEARRLVNAEVEDNVRLFVPEAPLNNLEAMSFGVGLASVVFVLTLVWILRRRPRLDPGWYIALGWIVLMFAAFSVLGKGVQRYLTPMWPAIAIVASLGACQATADAMRGARWRNVLAVVVGVLALAQSWWYGWGREMANAERSPRDLLTDLQALQGQREGGARLFSVEFSHPAMDYYADRYVQPVGDAGVNSAMAGGESWTFERLEQYVAKNPETIAFMRRGRQPGVDAPPVIERLSKRGFVVEEICPDCRGFAIDRGRSEVRGYRLTFDRTASPVP